MGLLRSEPMRRGTLVLPSERAREYANLLGSNVHLQFIDMNAHSLKRPYQNFCRRLDEMERIYRVLLEEVEKSDVDLPLIDEHHESFLEREKDYSLDNVERDMTSCYNRIDQAKKNNLDLVKDVDASLMTKHVLEVGINKGFCQDGPIPLGRPTERDDASPSRERLLDQIQDDRLQRAEAGMVFCSISGVINERDRIKLDRTIFQASRGNALTNFVPIGKLWDPKSEQNEEKTVFFLFFQGGSTSVLRTKLTKICQAYDAFIVDCPTSLREAHAQLAKTMRGLADKQHTLDAYRNFIRAEVTSLCEPVTHDGNSLLCEWEMFCIKEKGIYAIVNCFEGEGSTVRAQVWFPDEEEEHIRRRLVEFSSASHFSAMLIPDQSLPDNATIPTFIKTNELSRPFQLMVDTYGVPNYQEANPALFTIITFPFLFGVMFGDILHGAVVLGFALALTANADRIPKESMLHAAKPFRYLLILMGMFSVYAGFMYCDFAAVGVNLFGSHYLPNPDGTWTMEWGAEGDKFGGPYPFGLDPAWKGAKNELLFVNSLKMKLSVLFGVLQMLLGIGLKFSNAFFFKNWIDLFCECIPQLIFMLSLFGYMDFLIMYKWVNQGPKPSIINVMISMGLGAPLDDPLFTGQVALQQSLMFWVLITIPWMFLPKPLLEWRQHNKKRLQRQAEYVPLTQHDENGFLAAPQTLTEGEKTLTEGEFDFGEHMIHQLIETIEYVLGSISHTASYLRLWALSLAHQQLSLVFLQKTVYAAMVFPAPWNAIGIFFSFGVLASVTMLVLITMDFLECFLHTLRLHWVEFQSKFFKGQGEAFQPFSHENNLLTHGDNK